MTLYILDDDNFEAPTGLPGKPVVSDKWDGEDEDEEVRVSNQFVFVIVKFVLWELFWPYVMPHHKTSRIFQNTEKIVFDWAF